jgi:hypothetical protein
VENDPGARAKIVLCTAVKNYSEGVEVINEDGEIIELERANRKDVGDADVNASSHVQRKGVLLEGEVIVAGYRDQ